MKYILSLLIILSSLTAIGQGTPTYQGNSTSISYNRGTVGALRMQLLPRGFYPFPTFDTLGTIWVDSAGRKDLYYHNGTARIRMATVPYVDSVALSIEAGSVDSSIYSTVTRLADSLHDLRNYVDSNNTIIYGNIATLQSDVVTIDSAVGVAFGAISALYDTLPNYVDTAMLNDSLQVVKALINLKQNYSDTTTWDATRYWVSTQIPSLSGYVPYTGATGNVDIGTHTFTAKDGVFNHSSGSGTALSVTKGGAGEALTVNKTSGSGNAMSVTGGVTQLSELHTTTPIADAYIASAATWNAKGSGTVTSIQLVGGTNVTITPTTAITTSGVYTISATGGGSSTIVKANEFNMLYKANGDTTIRGTTKVRIDTTDLRMEFAYDADTSRVPTDPHGGVKIWGSNRMGMGAIRINDTVSIPAALQRAFNGQVTSTIMPILNNYQYTGAFSRTNPALEAVGGGVTSRSGAYNATIQQLNYNISLATTGSSAGSQASLYINTLTGAPGLICGNTKFSGGGGRGTFNFCLPNYGSGNRIFIGYSTNTGNSAADPSTFTGNATIGIGKDAADNTLHFMHSSGVSGSVTKVNTGVTPNNENVYRVTVYVAPNSTFYIQLEVMSKTGTTTHILNPTTNVPPVETKLVMRQLTNNGLAGGVCSYGFIYFIEEIY